ncbi:MAG: iron-containing redox enzyme family protein [Deltaproteobacteria bacterium]|nr:iron-containing redox enzyme family protein [Deltaproteobacteria bacterium]
MPLDSISTPPTPSNRPALREIHVSPYDDDPRVFLARLRTLVRSHAAVNHPMLTRVAHVPFTREDFKVLGLQHYALVGMFTGYLERLLFTAPDSDAKQWLAKVLVDEYGEGSEGKDHTTLYREYLMAAGATEQELVQTPLHASVTDFVRSHLRLCTQEPFLVGLGAVGPGHEWSIPHMFPLLVRGLSRAGFTNEEIDYFRLHMLQDEDHGAWLEEALVLYAETREAQEQIYRGAMASLEARVRFWTGVQRKVVRWRQPANLHARTQSTPDHYDEGKELTLQQFREELVAAKMLPAAV